MGYTHYWTQTRSFTDDEWEEITADIREILTYVEHSLGVPLGDARGDRGTHPEFANGVIRFNGIGDDSHETFAVCRKRSRSWPGGSLGGDFCKTARKPYDIAVTACLCYLATVAETHTVSSDGRGPDFVAGLNTAREALPRKANVLDIPMDIMRDDRWTGPWISGHAPSGYAVHFCVNGKGYVEKTKTHEWYCFETHLELGQFLDKHKQAVFNAGGSTSLGSYGRIEPNIWNASGSFDQARHKRIARAQAKVLSRLFPFAPLLGRDEKPPAFVRPGELPRPEDNGTFCYSLSDLISKVSA